VHVSTVGVSALIRPDGRVLDRSTLFTPDVLQAVLPLRTTLTLADRWGAWPELLLVLLGLVASAGLAWSGRRTGSSQDRRGVDRADQPPVRGRPVERAEAG
jgi:apolipoprotein N-acyltransferase